MSRSCATVLADSRPMLYTMTDDRQLRWKNELVFIIRFFAARRLIMVTEILSLRVLEVEVALYFWYWCCCGWFFSRLIISIQRLFWRLFAGLIRII